jgi:hypothetical protein
MVRAHVHFYMIRISSYLHASVCQLFRTSVWKPIYVQPTPDMLRVCISLQ